MNHAGLSNFEPNDVDVLAASVIQAAFTVHRTLGPGLLESVYQRCLHYELEREGHPVAKEVAIPLAYGSVRFAAAYRVDLIVDQRLVVETKTVETITPLHRAQVLTYLKLLDLKLGLLINFNVPLLKHGIKRVVR